MDRTACTEPQCLYSTAIPLLPLWAVRPVQSLSACTRVHFTFTCLIIYAESSLHNCYMFRRYLQGADTNIPLKRLAIKQVTINIPQRIAHLRQECHNSKFGIFELLV